MLVLVLMLVVAENSRGGRRTKGAEGPSSLSPRRRRQQTSRGAQRGRLQHRVGVGVGAGQGLIRLCIEVARRGVSETCVVAVMSDVQSTVATAVIELLLLLSLKQLQLAACPASRCMLPRRARRKEGRV